MFRIKGHFPRQMGKKNTTWNLKQWAKKICMANHITYYKIKTPHSSRGKAGQWIKAMLSMKDTLTEIDQK